jgi:hypothetical protein
MDATPAGRSAALPLASVASSVKRTQLTLNLVNPKVRVELQLHVDASFTPVAGEGSRGGGREGGREGSAGGGEEEGRE